MERYVEDAVNASQGKFIGEAYDHRMAEIEAEFEAGITEGIEQGIKQGITQKEKEAALNFYKNGASKELICKSLNISEDKLNEYIIS